MSDLFEQLRAGGPLEHELAPAVDARCADVEPFLEELEELAEQLDVVEARIDALCPSWR